MNWYEVIGIIATLFVLLSFLMRDVKVIRIINIIGCIFFVVYGILIGSLSTWLLNGILIFIHIYYLVKFYMDKKKNEILETKEN